MSQMPLKRIEDFLLPEAEELVLPSGLVVTLRPPNSLEFYAAMGWLPGRIANAIRGEHPAVLPAEQAVEKTYKLITLVVVSPKFSLTPAEGEFHPRRLRDADRKAIDDWAAKWLNLGGGGDDLKSFRNRASRPVSDAGKSGGDVSPAPQRDPARKSPRLGD